MKAPTWGTAGLILSVGVSGCGWVCRAGHQQRSRELSCLSARFVPREKISLQISLVQSCPSSQNLLLQSLRQQLYGGCVVCQRRRCTGWRGRKGEIVRVCLCSRAFLGTCVRWLNFNHDSRAARKEPSMKTCARTRKCALSKSRLLAATPCTSASTIEP